VGDNRRYDLAYIEPGKWFNGAHLVRVQCKQGWLERENGTIVFNTVNIGVRPGRNHHIRNYIGDAEIFAVYVPDIEKVYMVPVEMTSHASKGYLRLAPTKNNQKKNIVWASDFELR